MSAPSTELKDDTPREPDYVVVTDPVSSETMELPTCAETNTIGLNTLAHAFPGAHGLKYKNPTTGASRALLIDASGTKFFPPPGGWADKVFTVIYQTEAAKRTLAGDANPKRKKRMDESAASDSDGESGLMRHGGQATAKLQRLNEDSAADEPARPSNNNNNGSNSTTSNSTTNNNKQASPPEKERPKESLPEAGLPCSDLIVLGLPYKCEEAELRKYFETFGKVVLCEIKRNANGESKGFGFVQMSTIEEQSAVLNTQHTIGTRKCQVKLPASKVMDVRPENVKLFVGRLTTKITDGRLRDFFGSEAKKVDPACRVTDVFIPSPFRGFAFVTLSDPYVAKVLLKKEDFLIDNVSVCISPAAPKPGPPVTFYPPQVRSFEPPPPTVWERQEPRFRREFFEQNRYLDSSSPVPSGSNQLVNNLETLNLNQMQPEVMQAAWKAFWSVAQPGPAPAAGRPLPPPSLLNGPAAPPPADYRLAPHRTPHHQQQQQQRHLGPNRQHWR